MNDSSMQRRPASTLAWAAFLGFLLSVIAHLVSFLGVSWRFEPKLFLLALGVGIFPLMFHMLLARQSANATDKHWRWENYFAPMPGWVKRALVLLGVYVGINFVLFFFLSEGGVPREDNGTYYLDNHGQTIRMLTKREYDAKKNYEIRGATGSFMLFYLIPFFYFWFPRTDTEARAKPKP